MSRAPVWGSPLVKPLKKDSLTALKFVTLSTHELSDRESSGPRTDTSLKNHGFCYILAGSSEQSQPFVTLENSSIKDICLAHRN
jgi:hypothetical protein